MFTSHLAHLATSRGSIETDTLSDSDSNACVWVWASQWLWWQLIVTVWWWPFSLPTALYISVDCDMLAGDTTLHTSGKDVLQIRSNIYIYIKDSDFVQNFAEKTQVLLCSANAWIGTHTTFLVIPKRCCLFSVVQSFQFEITTHLT